MTITQSRNLLNKLLKNFIKNRQLHILINGFNGSMGLAIRDYCENEIDITVHNFKNLDAFDAASAVIDFSSPDILQSLLEVCIESKLPLISGTTGFNDEHLNLLNAAKKSIPIMTASNMSLGMANLKNSIDEFLIKSSSAFKCKILDIHHTNKKDSPSGTALEILNFLEQFPETKIQHPITVNSQRIGDIFGIHRVEFQNNEEVITFQHIANSREVFASGAIQASKWISRQLPGIYTFADFLNKKL